jgi:hypothetical protein
MVQAVAVPLSITEEEERRRGVTGCVQAATPQPTPARKSITDAEGDNH